MNFRLQSILIWLILCSLALTSQAQRVRRPRRTVTVRDTTERQRRIITRRAQLQAVDTVATQRGPYNIVLSLGGGLSYYSTHLGVPPAIEQSHISRFGVPTSFRAMWYPDHRLRMGLETGWTTMYSYRGHIGSDNTRVYVSAIPVLIVFSMPLGWLSGTERSLTRRLALSVGTGVYINHSQINYLETVYSNTNSLGWMAAASYAHPVGKRFRIGGELKWYDAVAAENAAFTAELQLIWRAFSW